MADKTTPAVRPPWFKQAAACLRFASERNFDAAYTVLDALAARHGTDCLPQVLLAWCDTAIRATGLPVGTDTPIQVAWTPAEDPGRIQTADEVPPSIRWAGRLLAARASDDEAMFEALIGSVQSDAEWTAGVAAVLNICGATIAMTGHEVS